MPGGDYVQQLFQQSADPRSQEIGNERWVSLADWDEYDVAVERQFRDNDMIMVTPWVSDYERAFGNWYKSTETFG